MLLTCSSFILITILSFLLGRLTVMIWDITPAQWLCDYGFTPTSKHRSKERNIKYYTVPFCIIFFLYILQSILYELPLSILFLHIILLFSLLQLSIADIIFKILQDEWISLILILAPLFPGAWITKLQGFIVPVLGCIAMSVIQHIFHTSPLMGMGDVKLIAALGFCFGINGLAFILCYAFLGAGIWACVLLACRKAKKKDRISFGPFISIACFYFIFSTLSI